jgi:hypothetical protein
MMLVLLASAWCGMNLGLKSPYGRDSSAFGEKLMPETALVVPSNLHHNVPAIIEAAKTSLTDLATLYLATDAAGQSQATLDAKRRDLHRFLAFY